MDNVILPVPWMLNVYFIVTFILRKHNRAFSNVPSVWGLMMGSFFLQILTYGEGVQTN